MGHLPVHTTSVHHECELTEQCINNSCYVLSITRILRAGLPCQFRPQVVHSLYTIYLTCPTVEYIQLLSYVPVQSHCSCHPWTKTILFIKSTVARQPNHIYSVATFILCLAIVILLNLIEKSICYEFLK